MARRAAAGAPPALPRRPTPDELRDAVHRTIRDVVAPGLDVLFCGINPGLWSGATGHHFARPGNRFWPTLHAAGFTERQLAPFEERLLLARGLGITNVVRRTTATADQLAPEELVAGGRRLARLVRRHRPRVLAVLGIGAYRTAFARTRAGLGLQEETIGATRLWVLPNPSGINANYQRAELARLFGELREWVGSV
ncbi:MAG TPA: G/U mismatch-specific DNA glycosylase [Gemmatimonadaceae bacterium]